MLNIIRNIKPKIINNRRLRLLVMLYSKAYGLKNRMLSVFFRTFPFQMLRIAGVSLKYVWYNRHGYGAERSPLIKIIHVSNLERPLRDSLIIMRSAEMKAQAEDCPWVWILFLFDENESRVLPGNLLSAVQRVSKVTQLHMFWEKSAATDFINLYGHEDIRDNAIAKISNPEISDKIDRQDLVRFFSLASGSGTYTFSPSTMFNARNFVKLFDPSLAVVAVSVPPCLSDEFAAYSEKRKWLETIVAVASKFPRLKIIVVGLISPMQNDLYNLSGNISLTSSLGFSFSEELAIVKQADLFIGPMDHYSVIAIDSAMPCMIIGESERITSDATKSENCIHEFPNLAHDNIKSFYEALSKFLKEDDTMEKLHINTNEFFDGIQNNG